MRRITVDRDLCCGAGLCTAGAPAVFDQDDDAVVVLLDPTPAGPVWAAVEEAAFACPSGAIKIQNDEVG